MGCDIHLYLEYLGYKQESWTAQQFNELEWNPYHIDAGRCYEFFDILGLHEPDITKLVNVRGRSGFDCPMLPKSVYFKDLELSETIRKQYGGEPYDHSAGVIFASEWFNKIFWRTVKHHYTYKHISKHVRKAVKCYGLENVRLVYWFSS